MFNSLLDNLPKILRALNFARMIQLCILAILFTVLYIFWDSRSIIVEGIRAVSIQHQARSSIVGNENTVKAVKLLVNRSQLITGVQLVNTDFRSNTRTTAFFYSDRPDLQNMIDSAVYNRFFPTPLFMNTSAVSPETSAFAVLNNSRVIDIIGAEFVCYESKTTLLMKVAPGFEKISPVICSLSIPPWAGKFSGYMNLFLTRAPNLEEKNDIAFGARSLSSEIFDQEMSRR